MRIAVFIGVIILIGLIVIIFFVHSSSDGEESVSKIIKDIFSLGPKGCLILLVIALIIGGIIALIISHTTIENHGQFDDGMWMPH